MGYPSCIAVTGTLEAYGKCRIKTQYEIDLMLDGLLGELPEETPYDHQPFTDWRVVSSEGSYVYFNEQEIAEIRTVFVPDDGPGLGNPEPATELDDILAEDLLGGRRADTGRICLVNESLRADWLRVTDEYREPGQTFEEPEHDANSEGLEGTRAIIRLRYSKTHGEPSGACPHNSDNLYTVSMDDNYNAVAVRRPK